MDEYDIGMQGGFGRGIERPGRVDFYGHGPRGFKRSDQRITEDVCETLYADPRVDASDVEVAVSNGVVELWGHVDSRKTKRLIEDEIEHISGVRDVHNSLQVNEGPGQTG